MLHPFLNGQLTAWGKGPVGHHCKHEPLDWSTEVTGFERIGQNLCDPQLILQVVEHPGPTHLTSSSDPNPFVAIEHRFGLNHSLRTQEPANYESVEVDLEEVKASLVAFDELWEEGTLEERKAILAELVEDLRVTRDTAVLKLRFCLKRSWSYLGG